MQMGWNKKAGFGSGIRRNKISELNEFSRVVDMSVLENTKWPKNVYLLSPLFKKILYHLAAF